MATSRKKELVMIKEWSLTLRFNHWASALCIFTLIATGLYIARPFTVYQGETIDKFFMGHVRYIHLLFGVLLTFLFIQRVYIAFFSRFHADWKDFFAWADFKNTWTQIKFYLLLSEETPEHRFLYGPLQSGAYLAVMLMIFLIVLTGLILMGAGYDAGLISYVYAALRPVENLLGGLARVRWLHHILTWLFILFIMVHIYMAFWYDVVFRQGTVSSIISGRVFRYKEEDEE
ncbi:MAG: Quinone-reactive Ni/Fe-hydrogenase B-type cytochrome subunit [Deltaproteobacteria bacterium ADurb.Bin510]|nr:MAG: Quinone-reactive Ni/Fe-hydrogenase B-type cytochrome subunit [Deltaproteobacteria bacterium ADurb.Bin510]